MVQAVRWGERGARVNAISSGIIITPLANDQLRGPRGAGYKHMIEACPVGRAGTPDEVGNVAALLMGPDGAFINGSDFLVDGGRTASYWFGELAPENQVSCSSRGPFWPAPTELHWMGTVPACLIFAPTIYLR